MIVTKTHILFSVVQANHDDYLTQISLSQLLTTVQSKRQPKSAPLFVNTIQLSKYYSPQIRLWVIQVPVPKIAPIIVAVLPISDSNSAEELMVPLWKILNGLLERKIQVVSYAADGTAVERTLQQLLFDRAGRKVSHKIKHPGSADGIKIVIPFYGKDLDQPIAILQDANHGRKDAHNAVFSGAKEITIGDQVVLYVDFREMSLAEDGPTYRRDTSEKMDRQDDPAATRLLSAASLEWFKKNRPEKLGVMVYLFVFRELIDAYQSRTMTIEERVQITYFFMEIWENFVAAAGYPKHKYFISHEFRDVVRILIHGLLQLVYIYRDHIPGPPKPILFWLKMTESVEHVFGVSRNIVKDFTVLDYYEMNAKLHIQLRELMLNAETITGKTKANGYSHTYTDNRDLDIRALSTFPSDVEIDNASVRAHEEAENLFALLGVAASDVCVGESSSPNWFMPAIDEAEPELGLGLTCGSEIAGDESNGYDLQAAIEKLDDISMPTQKEDNTNMDLTYGEDANHICQTLAAALPSGSSDIVSIPHSSLSCDVQELVNIRRCHQTKQAETGVRTSIGASSPANLSECQQFLKRINEIIKLQQDHGIGTGAEHDLRWRKSAPGGRKGVVDGSLPPLPAGGTWLMPPLDKFRALSIPSELETARISALTPLSSAGYPGSAGSGYGFLVSVLSVYSKTGGKNGKHAWVSDCSSITAASNIPMQVYEHMSGGRQFRTVSQALQHLSVPQFALVPSTSFLCLLSSAPEPINAGLRLSVSDSAHFKTINGRSADIATAVKSLTARKKSGGTGKGKKKAMDAKLDSDDEISDFPDSLL
ncbi:hypothetical protein B0H13DRAFT_1656272 [Mycena leptocephala]|nr:hypothetical protein B0H13DRAFT_1656272 [Mycena leptocephala]